MSPVKQLGLGQTVARKVYEVIPHNAVSAWGIKIAEILTDAGKMPIEGVLYLKHGFVPDGVAAIVTQPLWSSIETAEKVAGVALKPEKVNTEDQILLSLGCIYGSLFRYFLVGIYLLIGSWLYRMVGEKGIEKVVGWIGRKIYSIISR